MKRFIHFSPKTELLIYRTLLGIAAALVLILIAGTIYGLIKKDKTTGEHVMYNLSEGEDIFSGLGTIRISTADPDPETVIIKIAFPYNRNDRPFSEELASRLSWFKTVTTQYFGELTAEEIAALDISTIHHELLTRYNSTLRLGQIRELYILEFMQL